MPSAAGLIIKNRVSKNAGDLAANSEILSIA
jgi:hypothetical protein